MNTLQKTLQLLISAHTIKGVSFVGVRGYENTQGEISNQLLNVGVSYEKMMQIDFDNLQRNKEKISIELGKKFSFELIDKAYNELYLSLEKRLSSPEVKEALRLENDKTIKRSDAQKDAYIHLTTGVKLCIESQKIHVFGFVEKKTILVPIEYKPTNSKELTICKRAIEKFCGCKLTKFKTFIFDKGEIKIKGFTL